MAEAASIQSPAPLKRNHNCGNFQSGIQPLDDHLKRFAWANQQAGVARTYVATRGNRVVGYYTLAFGSVEHEMASPRAGKGLARHPIPVIVLARLAVDRSHQGRGLGKGLLKDALLRTLQAAEIAGLRAMIVHAKDEHARQVYARFDFEPSPLDEFHLMLLLRDLRKVVTG
jgi:GNAT superfamily N-acetyltransferase